MCIRDRDAVPIRLGQEFNAYSVAVMRDIHRMDRAMEEMCTLNMGGTAVGTGINADEAYLRRIVPNLVEVSDMEFVQAYDLIDATPVSYTHLYPIPENKRISKYKEKWCA